MIHKNCIIIFLQTPYKICPNNCNCNQDGENRNRQRKMIFKCQISDIKIAQYFLKTHDNFCQRIMYVQGTVLVI